MHAAEWLMDCERETIRIEIHQVDRRATELWYHASLDDRHSRTWFAPYWTTQPNPRQHLQRRKQVRISLPIPPTK